MNSNHHAAGSAKAYALTGTLRKFLTMLTHSSVVTGTIIHGSHFEFDYLDAIS
jgi:hypothetical protein